MSIRCKRGCGFVHDEREICPTTQAVIDSLRFEVGMLELEVGMLERELAEARKQILLRNACLDRCRLLLNGICEHMDKGIAPLSDTWWYEGAETMYDAIIRTLEINKQSLKEGK